MCPVCTAGVIAGLGLSRWLGVDDTVSGIWIGGILASSSGWTINWLRRKKWNFKGSPALTVILFYATVIIPLYQMKIIGHVYNQYWGIDKLILGISIGTVFFTGAALIYEILKKKNGGHAHFPFEKIVFPIGTLVILSTIFYFLTK